MSYKKVKISDIGKIVSGATPKTKDVDNYGGSIAWITPADLSGYTSKYISHGSRNITQKGYDSCSTHLMPRGTVLFSSRAPIGYVAIAENPICTNQGFKSIVPNDDIDSEFLYYQLQYLRKKIQEKGSGTTFKEISGKVLGETDIVVPSLEEQSRIVAHIEELFSELDKAVDTLKTTKEQLEVYRQAVLKDAFSNIAEYIPFGKITSSRLGKMLDKQKNVGVPCKYLRNINVRWFSFDLSDLLDMKIEEKEFEKYTICKNDLVICEGGEPGRCAVWEKDETIFYQKALHRVRFTIKAEPRFYMYYLWHITQSGSINKFYTGTGIKHLTGQSLEKIPVPVTDIGEQKRLLELIEMRLSVCDNIEKTVDAALAQTDAMRQSILKQAFKEGSI